MDRMRYSIAAEQCLIKCVILVQLMERPRNNCTAEREKANFSVNHRSLRGLFTASIRLDVVAEEVTFESPLCNPNTADSIDLLMHIARHPASIISHLHLERRVRATVDAKTMARRLE